MTETQEESTQTKISREEAEAFVKQYVPSLAPLDTFLSYCSAHSQTERALFNGAQIGTLLLLAGYKTAFHWLKHPEVWRGIDLSDIVREAHKNIEPKPGESER